MNFTQHLNQETADRGSLSLPGSRMMDGALESISVKKCSKSSTLHTCKSSLISSNGWLSFQTMVHSIKIWHLLNQ